LLLFFGKVASVSCLLGQVSEGGGDVLHLCVAVIYLSAMAIGRTYIARQAERSREKNSDRTKVD
jgi:hypothetical protein